MGEIEEFVKGLRKILKGDMTTLKLKRLYTKSEEACARLEQQAKQIKQFEAENRWIPVSERLPKKTGEYLVLPYQKHKATMWYQGSWYWYDEQDDAISDTIGHNSDEPIFEITHWKPVRSIKD